MATTEDYIEFVCSQLPDDGATTRKKMFGEYMVYRSGKPVLLVCDNTVYVKKLPELASLLTGAECGIPYSGAKEHYILDIEDRKLTARVCALLEELTPLPKPRRKKTP